MSNSDSKPKGSRLFRAIGPGLVSACVVIGPGSILTSSKVGAVDGFSNIWVVVVAVLFMMVYVTLGMRLGVVSGKSNGELVRKHLGKWVSVLIGFSIFFISAAFQFGNNLGAHSALYAYGEFDYWIVILNGLVLFSLFGFRNLYASIERLMAGFVALMLLAFAINLYFALSLPVADPGPEKLASGDGLSTIGLPLLGLVGTTFVISVAFFQSYLVRFKGWTVKNLRNGQIDARVSATIMGVITILIMSTAAAVLRGNELLSVGDVADQLKPLFGEKGRAIFCAGLFAAAFSSFIVNSMIGGFILSDSLNIGNSPEDRWPKILTAAVLLIGMGMAFYVIKSGTKIVTAVVAAQAVTVLAAPLIAAVMLWLTNSKAVMGDKRNSMLMNIAAGVGLLLLVAMSIYVATEKVWPAVRDMFA